MNITIRQCSEADLDDLQVIAHETFDETFRPMNSRETIDRYLQDAFNKKRLTAELANKDSLFFFLYANQALAGYLKINDAPAQTDINDTESIEMERIYIRKAHKGKGLGEKLTDHALRMAADMQKKFIWLGVWEKNTAAISFYTKMGFHEAGRHLFRMGDELQRDLIMKKAI